MAASIDLSLRHRLAFKSSRHGVQSSLYQAVPKFILEVLANRESFPNTKALVLLGENSNSALSSIKARIVAWGSGLLLPLARAALSMADLRRKTALPVQDLGMIFLMRSRLRFGSVEICFISLNHCLGG